MWAKNGNLSNGVISWDGALSFITSMNTGNGLNGYKDWRLPNINEIQSLFHYGDLEYLSWQWNNLQIDLNSYYWSSTTSAAFQPFYYAAASNLGSGAESLFRKTATQGVDGHNNPFKMYFLPVRSYASGPSPVWKTGQNTSYAVSDDGDFKAGTPWPLPRFSDHADGTVTDNLTGLMWSKNANPAGSSKTWQGALDYVKTVNIGGYTDWRLPNIKELSSLVDWSKDSPILPANHPFQNVIFEKYGLYPGTLVYWSATTLQAETPGPFFPILLWDRAYIFDMAYGVIDGYKKTDSVYVWPLRNGLLGPAPSPSIAVMFSPVDFGNVPLGSYLEKDVFVVNRGNADLIIGTVSLPLDASAFVKKSDGCSSRTLVPLDFCMLTYRFTPVSVVAYSGSSDISSNDPQKAILTLILNASGVVETVSTPSVPSGPIIGTMDVSYSFTTTGSTSNVNHNIEYQFDWKGDGSVLSTWGDATQSKIWTGAGIYSVRVRARCSTDKAIESAWSPALSVTIMVEEVSTPSAPVGPPVGGVGTSYSYSALGSGSNLGHSLEYQFDWKGDGSDISSWNIATQSKTWSSPGIYNVRVKARCASDPTFESGWSPATQVTIWVPENVSPPTTISGPATGETGVAYSFITSGSISDLDHALEYQFDWKGNRSDLSSWGTGTQSKVWTTPGAYTIWARARCKLHTIFVSDWREGVLVVIAGKQRVFLPLVLR